MKALHVIQRYKPSSLTGSEAAMVLLCEALAKERRHTIRVITSDVVHGEGFYNPFEARHEKKVETLNNVKVRRLLVNWLVASVYYMLAKLFPLGGASAFKAFGPHLVGLELAILEARPDLIHVAPMPMAHLYFTWRIAKHHAIPLVITPDMHFDDPRFKNLLIDTILASAAAVIAHTEYEKAALSARGVAKERITVIPLSYLSANDFNLTAKLSQEPTVLFLGTKSFDKGTVHLLEVWPQVRQKIPQAKLIVAGVPTRSWVKGKKNKDFTNVEELDYVTGGTKQGLLSASHILVVPSRTESFGMVLLEAWAKGKPVIGGSAGATREMISEGRDGYTVNFGDVDNLAKKIINLLQNPTQQKQLGLAGRQKAKTFTKQRMVGRTLKVYRQVVQRKSG